MARVDVGRSDAELDQELAAVAGFANWPTTSARPRGSPASTKTGRHADVRIAHRFIRFLVEQQRVPLRAVSEFDLRVYLDDVLNQDDFRTAKPAAALLASLGRFFAYLAARTSAPISCPWAESVLDELAAFDQRRRGISELFFHGGSVAHCRQAMYDALTARLLVANILVSDSDLVTAWAGPFEREVEYQVQRLWLVWRDEIIRSETTRRDAVLRALCGRQARWEATPNPSVKGRTPREVIEAERRVFTPEFPMAKPSRAPKSHR